MRSKRLHRGAQTINVLDCSFERRVDQRRYGGDVLLQTVGQTEAPRDECALLVAHPDPSLHVAPHQNPQREVETDPRPPHHQRRPAPPVAQRTQPPLPPAPPPPSPPPPPPPPHAT